MSFVPFLFSVALQTGSLIVVSLVDRRIAHVDPGVRRIVCRLLTLQSLSHRWPGQRSPSRRSQQFVAIPGALYIMREVVKMMERRAQADSSVALSIGSSPSTTSNRGDPR